MPTHSGGHLATTGLVKLFGTTPALLRVELRVASGEICALLGGNGAGKSTLLRILATLLRPTSGRATVCGYDTVDEALQARREVDLLPDSGGSYPDLTAMENLRFALGMRGLEVPDSALAAALRTAGLGAAADDRVHTYSAGMRRRLGVARLGLTRPNVALLDEPYGALDAEGRDLVDTLVAELRSAGAAVVVATHEHDRAKALADRVCELDRGVLSRPHEPGGHRDGALVAARA